MGGQVRACGQCVRDSETCREMNHPVQGLLLVQLCSHLPHPGEKQPLRICPFQKKKYSTVMINVSQFKKIKRLSFQKTLNINPNINLPSLFLMFPSSQPEALLHLLSPLKSLPYIQHRYFVISRSGIEQQGSSIQYLPEEIKQLSPVPHHKLKVSSPFRLQAREFSLLFLRLTCSICRSIYSPLQSMLNSLPCIHSSTYHYRMSHTFKLRDNFIP